MSIPSVQMTMQIENEPTSINNMPEVSNVVFEVSAESVQTIIEGLGKIREQLSLIG